MIVAVFWVVVHLWNVGKFMPDYTAPYSGGYNIKFTFYAIKADKCIYTLQNCSLLCWRILGRFEGRVTIDKKLNVCIQSGIPFSVLKNHDGGWLKLFTESNRHWVGMANCTHWLYCNYRLNPVACEEIKFSSENLVVLYRLTELE